MKPVLLPAYTMASCLGHGLDETRAALRAGASRLAPCAFDTVALQTYTGEIPRLDAIRIPDRLARFDCRNNRAAEAAIARDGFADVVEAAARRYGPARVGVFMGTSTAGILQTELAYRRRDESGGLPADFDYRHTHNTFSVAEYTRERLGLTGPCAAISTACSSSAKAFASAQRLMDAGVIDAAVVGGVDTLCLTTLYGFNSLQLLSAQPCRPYDAERDGISLGEAAVFFLLERAEGHPRPESMALLGVGESCDAYHMSSPHPEGRGAHEAMRSALESANLSADGIDYLNLHGTGTPSNDSAEDHAVLALFGERVPVNSTKGMTGHALGAAGAAEALLSVLAIEAQRIPASPGTRVRDPKLGARYEIEGGVRRLARVMSNSFGFGGSNCSLVFGRLRDAA
jgi:3-oxoacyl-[acyl-carrier-protein] synthase-1